MEVVRRNLLLLLLLLLLRLEEGQEEEEEVPPLQRTVCVKSFPSGNNATRALKKNGIHLFRKRSNPSDTGRDRPGGSSTGHLPDSIPFYYIHKIREK